MMVLENVSPASNMDFRGVTLLVSHLFQAGLCAWLRVTIPLSLLHK